MILSYFFMLTVENIPQGQKRYSVEVPQVEREKV